MANRAMKDISLAYQSNESIIGPRLIPSRSIEWGSFSFGSGTNACEYLPEICSFDPQRKLEVATEPTSFAETPRNFPSIACLVSQVGRNDKLQQLLIVHGPPLAPYCMRRLPPKSDFALKKKPYHVVWPNHHPSRHGNSINLHYVHIASVWIP